MLKMFSAASLLYSALLLPIPLCRLLCAVGGVPASRISSGRDQVFYLLECVGKMEPLWDVFRASGKGIFGVVCPQLALGSAEELPVEEQPRKAPRASPSSARGWAQLVGGISD